MNQTVWGLASRGSKTQIPDRDHQQQMYAKAQTIRNVEAVANCRMIAWPKERKLSCHPQLLPKWNIIPLIPDTVIFSFQVKPSDL